MRKSVPKSTRFEVFKRDKFTCQYCGAKPPVDDVVLHVDHIKPVALGGTNSILNLITSCQSCNSGKSATPLDDNAALVKKRLQLDAEADKAEQIEMLMRWERHLESVSTDEADLVVDYIHSLAGVQMPEIMVAKVRRIAKKYGNEDTKAAAETCLDFYLKGDTEEEASRTLAFAISKLDSFCKTNQMEREHPGYSQIFYAAGIISKKYRYISKNEAIKRMMTAFNKGVPPYHLLYIANNEYKNKKDLFDRISRDEKTFDKNSFFSRASSDEMFKYFYRFGGQIDYTAVFFFVSNILNSRAYECASASIKSFDSENAQDLVNSLRVELDYLMAHSEIEAESQMKEFIDHGLCCQCHIRIVADVLFSGFGFFPEAMESLWRIESDIKKCGYELCSCNDPSDQMITIFEKCQSRLSGICTQQIPC